MENTQKTPPRYKGKSVYFNLDNPDDLRLYEHAMSIRNFSGYIKAIMFADLNRITNQSSDNEGDTIDK